MVKNTSGGNKTKRQKRNYGRYDAVDKVEDGQMFAQIIKNNGDHFTVLCSDNVTRLGRMSGILKKGPRLTVDSYVVISLRDFETEQKNCDIIAIGDPPTDIINIFKKNNINKSKKDDIDFDESDDEFKDFEESKKTIKHLSLEDNKINEDNTVNNTSKKEDEFDWDDI